MDNITMIRDAFGSASPCALRLASLLRQDRAAGPIGRAYGTSVSAESFASLTDKIAGPDFDGPMIKLSFAANETSALNAPSGVNAWSPPV